ncbi:SDR family NAD(P)-dependent oxidoreductase [Halomarina salina]|uniref:SDR family NAD(P)-dependent oxidoreductase n=1 Tax=Halomarina salina TaxID=1872699 RepID=A0ABD5RT45_9EURY|nr:SDR family oxidoreductase [Halomarina salina]
MISQFHVDGDTAIVTGASQGIGEAIAKTFADDGVNVALCSRSRDRFQSVVDDIEDAGGTVYAAECDVTDRERVFEFVDEVTAEFGDVDALVNNAGGSFQSPFEDLSENAWKTIIDINLHGAFHFTQAAGEVMREGDGGYIVSGAGLEGGMPDMSQYGAAKAALKNLTETLAGEWNEYGVRTNCIAPGLVATPGVVDSMGIEPGEMPPREQVDRYIGHPEETADLAQFLCSRAASYLNGSMIRAGLPSSERPDRERPS